MKFWKIMLALAVILTVAFLVVIIIDHSPVALIAKGCFALLWIYGATLYYYNKDKREEQEQ